MHAYRDAHARVQGLVSRWIGVEHAIESAPFFNLYIYFFLTSFADRVKAIIPANETLTPGILYVGIATLTGSILARNRFLPTRLLLPPAFLLMSMHHFLPQTTANLSTYLASLEDTYFPIAAEKHDIANAHMRMTWDRLKAATESGREGLGRGVVTAVDKAQAITGLKLKETLGWTQEKVVETTRVAEKKVTEVTEEAQKKSEDVKRLV